MKTIYLDLDFMCHVVNNDGSMISMETDFFDNMCDTFIEGYRFIPEGQAWTREDGEVFEGHMIAPGVDYELLDHAQRQYERNLLADTQNEKQELITSYNEGVNSI